MPFIFQDSPKWFQDYAQKLLEKSRELGAEKYIPYGVVSPEKNQQIKQEIEKLIKRQQGNVENDFIPLSITGSSKPINISPPDLLNIIKDEGYAKRVYEHVTGKKNVSQQDIGELRERASQQYQNYVPKIREWEESQAMRPQGEESGKQQEENEQKYQQNMKLLNEQSNELGVLYQKRKDFKQNAEGYEKIGDATSFKNYQDLLSKLYPEIESKEKILKELQEKLRFPPSSPLVEDLFSRLSAEKDIINYKRKEDR